VTNVMVITGGRVGVKMAGPAIRAWNIALTLSPENEVILVTTGILEAIDAPFALHHVDFGDEKRFAQLEAWAQVIIFQGDSMAIFKGLRRTSKIVVADVYDPMHLEHLEQSRELTPEGWARRVSDATWILNEQLARGDFFLCASERQRFLYIGQLGALGRINPKTYEADPNLANLLAVAPFGISEIPPEHTTQVLKGILPGIGLEDKVLIWGGGLYNWFDPGTLIRAVHEVSARHDNVRLFFQGTKHPGVPEMGIVGESRELARALGALDSTVFFNDSWVDFTDRQNYLLEADAGVSTHRLHIETTFSFRTRILDYLWAGLPMVVTEGDSFADLVEDHELGIVVPENDVDALAAALEKILFDREFIDRATANIDAIRARFYWNVTLDPLVKFVRNPHRAADRQEGGRPRGSASIRALEALKPPVPRRGIGLAQDLSNAMRAMKSGGLPLVLEKARRRVKRRH
jgi:glycosyltransferase involved in cell wall biosynthesis